MTRNSDEQTYRAQEAQAASEAEIVSYADDVLEIQDYRGLSYQVFAEPEGFRVRLVTDLGSHFEPWDCAFVSIEDADAHGRSYIDFLCENPS